MNQSLPPPPRAGLIIGRASGGFVPLIARGNREKVDMLKQRLGTFHQFGLTDHSVLGWNIRVEAKHIEIIKGIARECGMDVFKLVSGKPVLVP